VLIFSFVVSSEREVKFPALTVPVLGTKVSELSSFSFILGVCGPDPKTNTG
jgi:hypothetical protein